MVISFLGYGWRNPLEGISHILFLHLLVICCPYTWVIVVNRLVKSILAIVILKCKFVKRMTLQSVSINLQPSHVFTHDFWYFLLRGKKKTGLSNE